MLLEITIGGLIFLAYKKSGTKGIMTPKRQEAYDAAIVNLTDPDKLRELAATYEREGLPVEATMLRKRADLRGQSPEKKEERKAAFEKGMKSTDIQGIERLADAFESLTATGAASALRKRASQLRELQRANPAKSEHEFSDVPASNVSTPVPAPEEIKAAPVVVDELVVNSRVKDAVGSRIPPQSSLHNDPKDTVVSNGSGRYKRSADKPIIDTTGDVTE